VERGFESGSPDAEGESVLVVVGEEQLRVFVSEFGSPEIVLGIPDLAPHPLEIQEPVVSFAAFYVVGNAVAVAPMAPDEGEGQFFGGDAGARVRGG
jgi:hypothetical protein